MEAAENLRRGVMGRPASFYRQLAWLDPVGFAYSVDGPPPNLGGADIYYRQSKNWWVWRESW